MKIVLIGDSIRMGYQPLVAAKCKAFNVWGPAENCRHSLWALDGCHMTQFGNEVLADAVVEAIGP